MSFFVAKNIIKNYANHRALDDVSIEIPEGAIYGLLGPQRSRKDFSDPNYKPDYRTGFG